MTLDADGFAIVPNVLSTDECASLTPVHFRAASSGSSRCLLSAGWCSSLAKRLPEHPALRGLVPRGHVAVQCTYFEKSASRNWLVPVHQDLSIPVAARVDSPSLRGWSEKEDTVFVQAPVEVLEQMVAVRLHIDACTAADGPLRVVPGSHMQGIFTPQSALLARASLGEVVCEAGEGSTMVMRPLLLHASSKSSGTGRRRVLHFLYGPPSLPHGLRWRKERGSGSSTTPN